MNESKVFSLNVENCTFENNSYSHPKFDYTVYQDKSFDKDPYLKLLDNIGVINVVSHNPKVRVNKSRFLNNHFLSNGYNSSTSAVINMSLMTGGKIQRQLFASLEISESIFVNNNVDIFMPGFDFQNEDVQGQRIDYILRDNVFLNNTRRLFLKRSYNE